MSLYEKRIYRNESDYSYPTVTIPLPAVGGPILAHTLLRSASPPARSDARILQWRKFGQVPAPEWAAVPRCIRSSTGVRCPCSVQSSAPVVDLTNNSTEGPPPLTVNEYPGRSRIDTLKRQDPPSPAQSGPSLLKHHLSCRLLNLHRESLDRPRRKAG